MIFLLTSCREKYVIILYLVIGEAEAHISTHIKTFFYHKFIAKNRKFYHNNLSRLLILCWKSCGFFRKCGVVYWIDKW